MVRLCPTRGGQKLYGQCANKQGTSKPIKNNKYTYKIGKEGILQMLKGSIVKFMGEVCE